MHSTLSQDEGSTKAGCLTSIPNKIERVTLLGGGKGTTSSSGGLSVLQESILSMPRMPR